MKLLRNLIWRIFKVKKSSNKSFNHLQVILKEYGINTQKSLISLNTQKIGRMKIVAEISRPIDSLNKLKIGNNSKI